MLSPSSIIGISPILTQCSISIRPETSEKVLHRFQGGTEIKHWGKMA